MLMLASKLKRDDGLKGSGAAGCLLKRLQNLSLIYLVRVKCIFLIQTSFTVSAVTPDEGYYQGGKLQFETEVLNSLFTDLLNFDDQLNIEATEHLQDKEDFSNKVEDYIKHYAR
ncbi:hypothetical protein E2I00_000591 [Balaenoptera physalus]|uniref:Uncharacterized protein n=1 Tax=Balaenoptera physalus TaxID=9770 RepID=A0A643CAL3_BALPH|nr:hypothetical protein E2I00_000591 [Balaenoptera physalus]